MTMENDNSQEKQMDGQQDSDQHEGIAAPTVESLEAELNEMATKLNDAQDRLLRVAAEADNTRKRMEREKVETRMYAIQEFAKDLLPVIDAFDKAMNSMNDVQIDPDSEAGKMISNIMDGVKMVSKTFEDSVKKHGIERLPGKGSPFNPMYHNAIAKITDETLTQETVVDEFMPGYKIGDRILRTAMVRVGAPD